MKKTREWRRRFTGGLNSNRWQSARKTRRKKLEKKKKRCEDETEKTELFLVET